MYMCMSIYLSIHLSIHGGGERARGPRRAGANGAMRRSPRWPCLSRRPRRHAARCDTCLELPRFSGTSRWYAVIYDVV